MSNFDLSLVRSQFPALALQDAGRSAVYFDGPGGTQVPQSVVDAMGRYLIQANANHGGAFRTSQESDAILAAAHEAMADLLNAPSAREIIFGPNMTTLTFALSRAKGDLLKLQTQSWRVRDGNEDLRVCHFVPELCHRRRSYEGDHGQS